MQSDSIDAWNEQIRLIRTKKGIKVLTSNWVPTVKILRYQRITSLVWHGYDSIIFEWIFDEEDIYHVIILSESISLTVALPRVLPSNRYRRS